jgi:hypothetical protein
MKSNQGPGFIEFETRDLLQYPAEFSRSAPVKAALCLVEGIKQVIEGFAWQRIKQRCRIQTACEAGGDIGSPQRKLWVMSQTRGKLAKRAAYTGARAFMPPFQGSDWSRNANPQLALWATGISPASQAFAVQTR